MKSANEILAAFLNTPGMQDSFASVGKRMFPDAVPQQDGIGMTIPPEKQRPYAERIFGDASQWDDKTRQAVKDYFKNKDVNIDDVRRKALATGGLALASTMLTPAAVFGASRQFMPSDIAKLPDFPAKENPLPTAAQDFKFGRYGRMGGGRPTKQNFPPKRSLPTDRPPTDTEILINWLKNLYR